MYNHELSNGGRSIIMETLKKYKKTKILMLSDYEAVVKAISDIPVKTTMYSFVEGKQAKNIGSDLGMRQIEEFGLE